MTSRGLVWKNLFRKKLRTFLTIFAILVAFLIYGVTAAFQLTLQAPSSGPQTTRLIATNKINFTEPLPIAYVNKVAAMEEVARVSHASWFGGYYQENVNFVMTFAVDPATYMEVYREFQLPPEQLEAFKKDRQAILLGRPLATRYGWKVGDRLPLKSDIFIKKDGSDAYDFHVVGIFETNDVKGADDQALFNYDYFNEARAFGNDMIGLMAIETKDPSKNAETARKIDEMFANSAYETETRSEAAFGETFTQQFGNIGFIVTAVVVAAFVTILLIVGNTMMLTVRERTGEIAVLKTIGFTANRIFTMILSESMLLALLGGLIGLGLAWVAVNMLASAPVGFFAAMAITPATALTAFGLMIGLGLVTGLLPAWTAMKTDIITAFARK